ncbi:MAG TPA: zinc-ribbon domain-containing protein [Acidobacteriaceae bacterium]|nr:zinc-ribbon domain-containing protein [Acidobacteriaceae bacterium]
MASFCTKCGASLNAGSQFCTACGAPAGAAAAPSAAPYMPPPGAQPVPAGPGSGGSSAVKVILIVVGVLVGLCILGACIFAFTIWRVAHAVHVEGHGDKVTLHTPGGTFSANNSTTYSAADLGIDLYPGAEGQHGGSKIETPNGSVMTGVFRTSDSKDQVVSFYKSKMGSGASVYDTSNGALLTVNKGDHESVMVTVNADPSQHDGKTQITIVHSHSTK